MPESINQRMSLKFDETVSIGKQSMAPLISIVVPVYNVEKYLNKCIDSLLSQSYKNIEIIMVDDGSLDRCGVICDAYANSFENCYVIHNNNSGLGLARNSGLENIHGEYVAFVDSDDWVNINLIQRLYDGLVANKVDVCKSGFRHVRNDGTVTSEARYSNEVFQGEDAKKKFLPRLIGSSPCEHDSIEMSVCCTLYKTTHIKEHNIKFVSERKLISEDLVFNIEYMQYANGACTISTVDYNYRINSNSLTTSYRPDRYRASAYFYTQMREKLSGLGYDELTFLRLKRMFFILTRMSISQETKKVSKLEFHDNLKNINKICSDAVIRDAIREYPVNQLGVMQKVFLKLIENKAVLLLYILAEAGVI